MASRFGRMASLIVPLLLLALVAAQPAPAIGSCSSPPDIVPEVDLTSGTTGTAWTVVQGTTPVSFDVEVLGTLTDALAPGKDLILIKVSGPVIDATGGIAAGMSGSPVYVSGKLAGSVSYGFYFGDHTIGGMTPAEDIVDVIGYPDPAAPKTIKVPDDQRGAAAREAGVPLEAIPSSLAPIALPVAVSGLSAHGIGLLQRQLDAHGANVRLFPAGSVDAPAPADPLPPPLVAGESMAAVASYGDVTFGAIGTVTAVCGDQVMGWGHPYWREGKTQMGMAGADIITVVDDPSGVEGPFKMGNLGEAHGVIDQDRLSGIRGVEGKLPTLVPVTSHLTNTELGTSRDGETDIVMTKYLADLAAFHVYGNQDVVGDWTGAGSSSLNWSIQGTEDGTPFELNYGDVFYSSWDFAYENVFALYGQLAMLTSFDGVKITSVDVNGSVTPDELRAEITDVWVASPAKPALKPRSSLKARPGDKLTLRVFLDPVVGPNTSVDVTYKIPRWARGSGPLVVSGGAQDGYYYYYMYYGSDSDSPATAQEYIADTAASARNSDIVVSLFPRHHSAEDEAHYRQDTQISGESDIRLILSR